MTLLKVLGVSLFAIAFFTLFANILPQVESEPPKEEEIEPGALDLAGQIAWGERLFAGKGTCTLCHNELGRAPDLLTMTLGAALPERLVDARYEGAAKGGEGAKAIETYLRESLVEPSVFVVAGFGKKGTNDTESPMPNVSAAPISLNAPQIDALIAFLQDRAGFEVSVALPSEAETSVAAVDEEDEEGEAPAVTAEEAIDKFACSACHDLADSGADVGPQLAGIASRFDRAQLRGAILSPNDEIANGFEADLMPADYGEQMRAGELELLLDHLMALPALEGEG